MIEFFKDKLDEVKEHYKPYHSYLIGFLICLGNGWWIFTKQKENFHVWLSAVLALVFFSLSVWSYFKIKKETRNKKESSKSGFDFDVFKK